MMVNVELNAWAKLQFHDPESVLRELRKIQVELLPRMTDKRVRNLRTPQLKAEREARDAAIFAHGIGKVLGAKVLMARSESSDYDFVTCWRSDDVLSFCPVQLKELPPEELNANISIASLLEGLAQPSASSDTVLAVKLNREMRFEYPVQVPGSLRFRQLWFFGGVSEDQNNWFLYGDALAEAAFINFFYPE